MNPLQRRLAGGAASIAALIIVAFLPSNYHQFVRQGTDTFKAHAPLLGEHVLTQSITTAPNLNGVGLIIVDLKKSQQLTPVTVRLLQGSEEVGIGTIAPSTIEDDTFAWASFAHTIKNPPENLTIEISAHEATSKNPIGVRFDQDTKQIALSLSRQVPLWQQAPLWITTHPDTANYIQRVGIITILIAAVIYGFTLWAKKSRWGLRVALTTLAILTVAIRIPVVQEVESVFGGDAFNYFFKASAWILGYDPFAADARKGPLYAAALIPGLVMPDPLLWGKTINVASAAATVVMIPLILLAFEVPLVIALAGGVIASVNRQLWWESAHSLGNIPYTALITASILIYIKAHNRVKGYWLGLLGGLTTLTRYEGVVVSGILLPALWLSRRYKWGQILHSALPLIILLAIPFVFAPLGGPSGVRTWSDIESDGGLSLAHSLDDFKSNGQLYRLYIGRLWILPPLVGEQSTAALGGITLVILLTLGAQRLPKTIQGIKNILPYAACIYIFSIIFSPGVDTTKHMSLLFTFLMGAGLAYGTIKKPRFAIPIVLIFITQSLIVTWILPKDRYYVQLIPIVTMALALGIAAVSRSLLSKKRLYIGVVLVASFIAAIIYVESKHDLGGLIENYNQQSEETTPLLKAARYLRPRAQQAAIATDYLPLRVYLTDARINIPQNTKPTDDLMQWVVDQHVDYIMETNLQPTFATTIKNHPEKFTKQQTFTSSLKETTADIYLVKQ